tara:strand:- start:891 stop:1352 length:462 start_codon:yes stop_codon:yes gene_type:complete
MAEKPSPKAKDIAIEEDDKPDYQEKITFLVSTVAQGAILAWCLLVLSLGYVKLPSRLFGVDIPDQPRVDSTFAAGLLGNILGGLGISVNAAAGAKKKKKEDESNGNGVKPANGSGYQTIIIKQPIELITRKPDVIRVDPITGKDVKNDGTLGT